MDRKSMLRMAVLLGSVSSLSLGAVRCRAETYQLDNSHTSVIFAISHLGYSFTYGRFNKVDGNFTLEANNPAASQFQFTIDASSVDTNDEKRDEHLRGPDFFNVRQFPDIRFESMQVTPSAEGLDVIGSLTIHGVTQQVTLPMRKLGEGPGPGGEYRTGFYLQVPLKRSAFGMTGMIPQIGDDVSVTISFEGIQR